MSVANAANQTYMGNQVSIGTYTSDDQDANSVDYTETSQLTPDTLAIGAVTTTSGGTMVVNYTYTQGGSVVSGSGRVIANSTTGFIFSSTVFGTTTTFYVTNTPQTGTTATVPRESVAPVYVACYCAGTMIRTLSGDIAVEELQVGDQLATVSGSVQPVRWIGQRSYTGRFFSANQGVWPIRFSAGSLGFDTDGQPMPGRDLMVSPKHAMLIDGYLVPAELLVNGRTIVRDGSAGAVAYFHVELPSHDVIWAENAPSETFADDASRMMFHNADTFATAYPDAVDEAPVYYAPRLEEGTTLEAILHKLGALSAPVQRAA